MLRLSCFLVRGKRKLELHASEQNQLKMSARPGRATTAAGGAIERGVAQTPNREMPVTYREGQHDNVAQPCDTLIGNVCSCKSLARILPVGGGTS